MAPRFHARISMASARLTDSASLAVLRTEARFVSHAGGYGFACALPVGVTVQTEGGPRFKPIVDLQSVLRWPLGLLFVFLAGKRLKKHSEVEK
jgi:hypothetical protein